MMLRRFASRVPFSAVFAAMLAGLAMAASAAQAEVSITNHATQNMTCSDGVCSPTAKRAYLNVKDLQKLLKHADIKVTTGAGAVTMGVDSPLSWSSGHRLTLDAIYRVEIKAPVTVKDTGALSIVYNDGGTGGDLLFINEGSVTFRDRNSSLAINGNSYVLAGDLAALAADMQSNISGFYALAADYDAAQDGIYTHAPLPGFSGTFEGLGNRIRNLSVQLAPNNTEGGLFSCGCPGSALRDIVLDRVAIRGADNADYVGALAGVSYGLVDGVRVSGSVRGGKAKAVNDTVGGLVGLAHGLVIDSYSSAKVSDGAVVGGLVGDLEPSGAASPTIAQSGATGAVAGRPGADAGGLVGVSGLSSGSEIIENAYATGSVRAAQCNACGGLVGSNTGAIANSYATGAVDAGGGTAGGLIGKDFIRTGEPERHLLGRGYLRHRRSVAGRRQQGRRSRHHRPHRRAIEIGTARGLRSRDLEPGRGHQRRLSLSPRQPAAAIVALRKE